MELINGDREADRDTAPIGVDAEHSLLFSHRNRGRGPFFPSPGDVRLRAYRFDGCGGFFSRDWDIAEAESSPHEFNWFHVDLPKWNHKLSVSAQLLIDALCPPLKLQDILSLVSNGPFCAHVDGALIFRVNSPGPATSDFTLRLAARVTEDAVITVSLGRVPRLGFSQTGKSLLSEIPVVEHGRGDEDEEEGVGGNGIVIREHVLEFLLTMNHSEEADNPVPRSVSDLVVHVIDTHVDHVQDIVTRLEMQLDSVELELDKGGSALKKQMLDDRRFPKMHLDLQRLLQVVAHGEQVFPRVKEKCAAKNWFLNENIIALEELIGRLRRLKENLGFIVNRVTAIQAGLDSCIWYECWGSAVDRAEGPRTKRWFSQCFTALCCYVVVASILLHFPGYLSAYHSLEKASCIEKIMVSQQKVLLEKNASKRRISGRRRLCSSLEKLFVRCPNGSERSEVVLGGIQLRPWRRVIRTPHRIIAPVFKDLHVYHMILINLNLFI